MTTQKKRYPTGIKRKGDFIMAFCSSCGTQVADKELGGSGEISVGIKNFITQINEIDAEIASAGTRRGKRGWASWGMGNNVEWVILNIYTLALPIIFGLLKNIFFPLKLSLTGPDMKKNSIISNFVIPNSREDLLECMLFAASKIRDAIGMIERTDSGKPWSLYWVQTWVNKSHQLYDKAKLVLPGEANLESFSHAIEAGEAALQKDKTQNCIKLGVLVGAMLAIAALVFVAIINLSGSTIKVSDSKTYDLSETEITGKLEDYFKVTTVTLEKTKDTKQLIDAKINEMLTRKGWSMND
jgi:hypothetical protein